MHTRASRGTGANDMMNWSLDDNGELSGVLGLLTSASNGRVCFSINGWSDHV